MTDREKGEKIHRMLQYIVVDSILDDRLRMHYSAWSFIEFKEIEKNEYIIRGLFEILLKDKVATAIGRTKVKIDNEAAKSAYHIENYKPKRSMKFTVEQEEIAQYIVHAVREKHGISTSELYSQFSKTNTDEKIQAYTPVFHALEAMNVITKQPRSGRLTPGINFYSFESMNELIERNSTASGVTIGNVGSIVSGNNNTVNTDISDSFKSNQPSKTSSLNRIYWVIGIIGVIVAIAWTIYQWVTI